MLGVAAQRIAWPIRKPRNNADECHCAETRRDGAFRAMCFVAPLARGACHGRRVASRISSRKASVAATRDLFRGSLVSIYTPRAFAADDGAAVTHLISDYPFATLMTPGDPEPYVSHVPLEYHAEREPKGIVLGHMARANPHWRHFGAGPSIAIFHGPHAYVSP